MDKILVVNHDERITLNEIINHPFLTGYEPHYIIRPTYSIALGNTSTFILYKCFSTVLH